MTDSFDELELIPYAHDLSLMYDKTPKMEWCYIFDLDGTLAIRGDRDPYDWTRIKEDNLNKDIKHLTNMTDGYGRGSSVFIFTGRPETCRDSTEDWLECRDDCVSFDKLIMRKKGDLRDDRIVKYEMFNEHIRGKYNVRFVVDDRPKLCRMWRKMGLTVLQVGNPDVEF